MSGEAAEGRQKAASGLSREPFLQIQGLSKTFTGTRALDNVDFDVYSGEIHALLGENGAGKSTLIKILAGVPEYDPDEGEFWIKGQKIQLHAQELPISFIHQELGLIPTMTVAENIAIVLGYRKRRGLISWGETKKRASDVLKMLGSTVDCDTVVSALPAAERSIVAISRALAVRADLIVLDEPTATLPENDVARLFTFLKQLREKNVGIIYVTHRLDEVYRIADRVTVLRNGKKVSTTMVKDTSPDELVFKIVGRPPAEVFIEPPPPAAKLLMEVEGFKVGCVPSVSFRLKEGEILGLVGLRGAGHQDVGRGLFGIMEECSGSVRIMGEEVHVKSPSEAMNSGIGFLSSKRAEESLAGSLFVRENIYLNPIVNTEDSLLTIMSKKDEKDRCDSALTRFTVKPRDGERIVTTLSGGNQQKVILARWFETGSRILILEEPTFGVDVGAKTDIYRMMEAGLKEGRSVLLISSDFEEVAGICHRAIVFNRGCVIAEVPKEELSIERLTGLASGIDDHMNRRSQGS
jgi:ribose transport system ATP-binding protein